MSRLWYGEASDTWLGQTPLKSLCPEGAQAGYVPTWDPSALSITGKMTGAFVPKPVPVSPGGGNAIVAPFTFASGTIVLQAVTAGQSVTRAEVLVETPFSDGAATLEMGTTTDAGLVFAPGEVLLGGEQTVSLVIAAFSAADFLLLTIEPGTSTVGAGTLYYWIQ